MYHMYVYASLNKMPTRMAPHCFPPPLFVTFPVLSSAVGDMIKPETAGWRDAEEAALRRFHRRRHEEREAFGAAKQRGG